MDDLGWTIDSIGYNKDANAYRTKISTTTAGIGFALNGLYGRSRKNKSDVFKIIVFFYILTGFIVGTWGYIKQAIIWTKAAYQDRVTWGGALAHILIPPIAFAFPFIFFVLLRELSVNNTEANHTILYILLASPVFSFLIAYFTLANINKNSGVDDFIGFGSALFQSLSCLIVYPSILILILYPSPLATESPNRQPISQVETNNPLTIEEERQETVSIPNKVEEQQQTIKQSPVVNIETPQGHESDGAITYPPQQTNSMTTSREDSYSALVYDPPSNIRITPDGELLCTINQPTNIKVYGYAGSIYKGTREVKWYFTDVCGSMGVIASTQFR